MSLTIKNRNNFTLSDDLASVFSLPTEEKTEDYNSLKQNIFSLSIDNEEKANIINKINLLSTTKNNKTKREIKKEIEIFKDKYSL